MYVHHAFNYADKGALEATELSYEVPGEDNGEAPPIVGHDKEEEPYMRMAEEEAEKSPDKQIKVRNS